MLQGTSLSLFSYVSVLPFPWVVCPGAGLLGHRVCKRRTRLNLREPDSFPEWPSTSISDTWLISRSLDPLQFSMTQLLNGCQPNRCQMLSHRAFNWGFSDHQWFWTSGHILSSFLCFSSVVHLCMSFTHFSVEVSGLFPLLIRRKGEQTVRRKERRKRDNQTHLYLTGWSWGQVEMKPFTSDRVLSLKSQKKKSLVNFSRKEGY